MPNTTTTAQNCANYRFFYTVPATHAERVKAVYINKKGNGKLGRNVWSFSTNPGNSEIILKSGVIVSNHVGTCQNCRACFGGDHAGECYAEREMRQYKETAAAYTRNTAILREDPAAVYEAMRDALQKAKNSKRAKMPKLFRVNESGDFTPEEVEIFRRLALEFPEVTFFTYTKHTEMVHDARERLQASGQQWPANYVIRASQWRDADGVETVPNPDNLPTFHYDDGTHEDVRNMPHCPAVKPDGTRTGKTCDACTLCANGKIHNMAVYAH